MLFTSAALLVQAASSALIFQSVWPVQECQGPPSAMYKFAILGASRTPDPRDIYAPRSFYNYSRSVLLGFTTLGPAYTLKPKQSCITWLSDVSLVDNTPSTSYDYWEFSSGDAIPTGANGYNYCLLAPVDFQALDLYSFLQFYVQEGQCAKGMTCGAGGLLTVNTTGICGSSTTSTTTTLPLNSTSQVINYATGPKNFNARFIPITQANVNLIWRSYAPDRYVYPTFKEPWEIVGAAFSALSMLFLLLSLVYYLVTYVAKNYSHAPLYSAVGQLIWLVSNIFVCSLLFSSSASPQANIILFAVSSITRALATLYSIFHSSSTMLNIKAVSPRNRYIVFGSLAFLHLALCGAMYLTWVPSTTLSAESLSIVTNWAGFFTWWVVLVFALLLSPPFYLIYVVVLRKKGFGGPWLRFKNIFLMKPKFSALICLMFTSIIVWIVLKQIDSWNPVYFGGQRIRNSFSSVRELFITAPFLLNCIFLDYIPTLISSMKSMKSKKKSQASQSKLSKQTNRGTDKKSFLNRFFSQQSLSSLAASPLKSNTSESKISKHSLKATDKKSRQPRFQSQQSLSSTAASPLKSNTSESKTSIKVTDKKLRQNEQSLSSLAVSSSSPGATRPESSRKTKVQAPQSPLSNREFECDTDLAQDLTQDMTQDMTQESETINVDMTQDMTQDSETINVV